MKKIQIFPILALLVALTLSMSGCQVIGDIFKAGVWAGVLMVVVVVGLIIFLISRIFGGGK
ncbi:MAG: phosphatidate cytidylyltransferase [Flavipsychrobacter sp.]|nr:phosphatidate cytidylyltransferase [Flavipsychrobacter sp.]